MIGKFGSSVQYTVNDKLNNRIIRGLAVQSLIPLAAASYLDQSVCQTTNHSATHSRNRSIYQTRQLDISTDTTNQLVSQTNQHTTSHSANEMNDQSTNQLKAHFNLPAFDHKQPSIQRMNENLNHDKYQSPHSIKQTIRHFAVYGSLRDDDHHNISSHNDWTLHFLVGLQSARHGVISGVKLFWSRKLNFPWVIITDDDKDVLSVRVLSFDQVQPSSHQSNTRLLQKSTYETTNQTHRQTTNQSAIQSNDVFLNKLTHADLIENYDDNNEESSEYIRRAIDVTLIDSCDISAHSAADPSNHQSVSHRSINQSISHSVDRATAKETVKCWFYLPRNIDCLTDDVELIESGDWTKRYETSAPVK